MSRSPPASGTPFIGRPRAKKKSQGPTEEGRPKQNFLVYPRTPPHRQADAIMSAASSTLERDPELIDAKPSGFSRLSSESPLPPKRLRYFPETLSNTWTYAWAASVASSLPSLVRAKSSTYLNCPGSVPSEPKVMTC